MKATVDFSKALLWPATALQVAMLAYRLSQGLVARTERFSELGPVDVIGSFLLLVFAIGHLSAAVLFRKARKANLIASVTSVGTLCLVATLVHSQITRNRDWFLRDGWRRYQAVVDLIVCNQAELTSDMRPLEYIVNPNSIPPITEIRGATNSDGAIIIQLLGRGGDPRSGYLYYSGNDLRPKLGRSNPCSFPGRDGFTYWYLTNNWYEY